MAGDEQVRALVKRFAEASQSRQAVELTEDECWRLLGTVSLGRIVFTRRALPAIRPVNHLTDGQAIIVRSHLGADIVAHASDDGAVVCYEADELDPDRHTGWSVIATGLASLVREPVRVARYQEMLNPWIMGQMDYVLEIRPQIITGIHLAGWCR